MTQRRWILLGQRHWMLLENVAVLLCIISVLFKLLYQVLFVYLRLRACGVVMHCISEIELLLLMFKPHFANHLIFSKLISFPLLKFCDFSLVLADGCWSFLLVFSLQHLLEIWFWSKLLGWFVSVMGKYLGFIWTSRNVSSWTCHMLGLWLQVAHGKIRVKTIRL